MLPDLNVCSQKGLVERFDGSIGAGSVFMPYGGRYQLTETQAMVAKLPVLKGHTDTVTMMSYGFDPGFPAGAHTGAVYAVVSSVAKIVAAGGDYSRIRFTFQSISEGMTRTHPGGASPSPHFWAPTAHSWALACPPSEERTACPGTLTRRTVKLNVPPTLVSFAVDVNSHKNVITPEFKRPGSKIVVFRIAKNQYDLPDYSQVMDGYGKIFEDIKAGRIISAYAVEGNALQRQ